MKTKYLIIGNSAGAIGAVEAIRQIDKEGSITIVSDEPYPVYSRPLISKFLARERTLEGMLFRSADFYEQNNITFLPGKKVRRLEMGQRIAQLDDGDQVLWDKLLLALGGKPIVPDIQGDNKEGIFTFTTLDDAKAIDNFLNNAQKAVVIGGGLIGISATEALVKRGIEVTVVEMKERILNTIIDEQASSMAEKVIQYAGVEIITNHTVAEITGRDTVQGVILDNGDNITCDLVLVAIGVSPRFQLVQDTGMEINRGIVVDEHMSTNLTDVYACGDVVEAYDYIYRQKRPIPIWPSAYIGGRIAGNNMAGVADEYAGSTPMNSLNYFGIDIASAGMPIAPDDTYEIISKQEGDIYKKIILKDDLIIGMVFVGDIEKSGIIFGLMRNKVNIACFKERLLSDDFGLAFLSRTIWQEQLAPPPEVIIQTALPVQPEEESIVDE